MDSDLRPSQPLTNLDHLDAIAREDVEGLKKAQKSYGDSWKKRGGVGAFMMLARKWDRLEEALRPGDGAAQGQARIARGTTDACSAYDIFRAAELDKRSEGLIDDIRDLRRYFLLVESELRARGVIHGTHRDNQPEPAPRATVRGSES
jgi:hypothetical protein